MAWSDQQYSDNGAPRNMSPPVPSAGPVPGYYGNNPLQGPQQGPMAQPGRPMPSEAYGPGANPLAQAIPQPTPQMMPGQQTSAMPGMPPMVAPAAAVAQVDDDKLDIDDVEWVNRTKRTIAGTRGDPHRQVQLIQHLRSQYLKQRYGRTVHTDEA